jgi:malate dehydrogenase
MGGVLDSFRTYLSLALDKPANDISAMVIGGHGDTTMIPLTRWFYNGIQFLNFYRKKNCKSSCRYMVGGATLQVFLEHQLGMLLGSPLLW